MNEPLSGIGAVPRALIARLALLLALSASCSYVAMAAVVSLQPPANSGVLHIPVLVAGEGDEALAGLQFDLHYDEAHYVLEAIEAGGATTGAGKEAILSLPAPGMGRVLITGFNDNILADGHVATLVLRPRTPDAAAHGLSVRNLLATDGHGYSVPIAFQDDYGYPPGAPEKQEPRRSEEAGGGTPEEGAGVNNGVDVGEPPGTTDLASETRADEDTATANTFADSPADVRDGSEPPAAATLPGQRPDPGLVVGGGTPDATRGNASATRTTTTTPAPTFRPEQGRAGNAGNVRGQTAPSRPFERSPQPIPDGTAPGFEAHERADGDGGTLQLALVTPLRRGVDSHAAGVPGALVDSAGPVAGTGGRPFAGAVLFAIFFVAFCALHWRMVRWLSRPGRRRAP